LVADAEWIVEAIIERLDLKQDLYRKLDAIRAPGSAVTSNTSTIPLARLTEGLSEAFARDFFITHFFNPPRYMRLLEVVAAPATDAALVAKISAVADVALGKSVVVAKDSPGFIANRLGVYWLQKAVIEALDHGLTVEEADALIGSRALGIPKTGVFGLIDLVGLDLMPHINASLSGALPAADAFHSVNRDLPLIKKMIAEGYTGRKGKGGFYRRGANKSREAIDLQTGAYRPVQKAPTVEARGIKALVEASPYAWAVMSATLVYAASLVPEAAGDIHAIDEAMRLGYNWQSGPFELIDALGTAWFAARLEAEGRAVPPLLAAARGKSFYKGLEYLGTDGAYHAVPRPDGVLLLSDLKRTRKPVMKNASAAVWDIGDGVLCLEFTSKSNSLDEQIMALYNQVLAAKPKALVIYNEGKNFSPGANLGLALFAANIAAWGEIEKLIAAGQTTYHALKYAPFPVVAAPAGMALGGGCEILLHCAAVQAHAELYTGLVEAGVGLIPGWGGCTQMLARWAAAPKMPRGPMPAVAKVFELISTATVSKSAAEAQEYLYLRPTDGVTMNRDRLLADAKAKALALAENYAPPAPPEYRLPGPSGAYALTMAAEGFHARGVATDYDLVVAKELAAILSGGEGDPTVPMTEAEVMTLEHTAFARLIRKPGTLARIEHILATGKPLRN
jgi:3-hydroxyacyl-CoA dehydrogenase